MLPSFLSDVESSISNQKFLKTCCAVDAIGASELFMPQQQAAGNSYKSAVVS
jgi:hypothetical protein